MPLITDPAFYAVAIPAAVLTGIGKSGVAGGFGILAVPLIALVMPVPQAAAIVLPLLTVGDLFGLAALIKERDRGLLRVLLPAGLAGIVVGYLLFGVLSPKTVSAVLGVMTLLFLAQRTWSKASAEPRAVPNWFTALAGAGVGHHQLRVARRRAADRDRAGADAARAGGVRGHHDRVLHRAQRVEVAALRVARL